MQESEQSGTPAESKQPTAPIALAEFDTFVNGPDHGLLRHRLVVGTCLSLAIGLLALSSVDLRGSIKRHATLDNAFHTRPEPQLAQLPAGWEYRRQPNYESGYGYGVFGLQPFDAATVSESLTEELIPVTGKSHQIGFADRSGHIVIQDQFSNVGSFHNGLARAEKNGAWGYVDKTGKYTALKGFSELSNFDGGAAIALLGSSTEGCRYQLIDRRGKNILARSVNQMPEDLGFGFAVAQNSKDNDLERAKYGVVDSHGNWLVKPIYDKIEVLNQTESLTSDAEESPYQSTYQGSFAVFTRIPGNHSELYAKVWKGRRCGVIDSTGKLVLAVRFQNVLSFKNGHFAVKTGNHIGFADLNGSLTIEPKYDFVTPYDKIIAAKTSKGWKFIDQSGKTISTPAIDGIICHENGNWLSDGLAPVISHDLCGFVDAQGSLVVPPRFKWTAGFSEGFAPVWDGTTWHYIDRKGSYTSQLAFAKAGKFSKGSADTLLAGPFYTIACSNAIKRENEVFDQLRKELVAHDFKAPPRDVDESALDRPMLRCGGCE